jgi:LysM repeat protein
MQKIHFLCLAVLAVFITISCKSTPAEVKVEPVPALTEETAFNDAYQAVLPLIMDGAERYVVKEGETLTKIARAKYGRGNAFFFPLIMAASKDQKTVDIADPDLIEPGMELSIPNLDANRDDPAIRERLKKLLVSVSNIYRDRPETRWSSEMIDGLLNSAQDL